MTFDNVTKLMSDERVLSQILHLIEKYVAPLCVASSIGVVVGICLFVDFSSGGDLLISGVFTAVYVLFYILAFVTRRILRKRRDTLATMRRMSTIANATPRRTH